MIGELADNRSVTITFFLLFITCSLFLSMLTSPDLRDGEDGFYVEEKPSGPLRHGLLFTGDFISAAGVLYLTGIVAVAGLDGMLIIGVTALSPLLMKIWLAERLPGGPGWSLGDVLARGLPTGPARRAAGFVALVATVPLLIVQLIPIGEITAALMGLPGDGGRIACTVLVGALMVACATIGGVRGASLLQIGKAVAFLFLTPLLATLVLHHFDWSLGGVFDKAAETSGAGEAYLEPGRLFGASTTGHLDMLSLGLTVLLGAAFLPHLVMRLTTGGGPEVVRRATGWATGAIALMCVAAPWSSAPVSRRSSASTD